MLSPSEQLPPGDLAASSVLEAAVAAITDGADAPPGACLAVSLGGEVAFAARGWRRRSTITGGSRTHRR